MASAEPRKRREDEVDQDLSRKRIAISNINPATREVIDEAFLETFQKDAIWREMSLYKSQLNSANAHISTLEENSSRLLNLLSRIVSNWNSVDSYLISICSAFSVEDFNSSRFGTAFFSILRSLEDQSLLKERVEFTVETFKTVIALFRQSSGSNYDMLDSKLALHFSSLSALLNSSQESDLLQLKVDELSKQLQDCKDRICHFERLEQRSQSIMVSRLKMTGSDIPIPATPITTTENPTQSNALSNPALPVDLNSLPNETKKLLAEIEELKEKCEILQEQAEFRLSELATVRSEKAKIAHQYDRAFLDLQVLPEHIIIETETFKYLESQFKHVREDVIVLKHKNEELMKENEHLNLEIISCSEKIFTEEKTKRSTLESEITKLTTDAARLRSMRDSIQAKYDRLNSYKQKTKEETDLLKKSMATQMEFTKIALSEIERVKLVLSSNSNDFTLYSTALISLDLLLKNQKEPSKDEISEYRTLLDSLQIWKTASDSKEQDVTLLNRKIADLESKVKLYQEHLPADLEAVGKESIVDHLLMKLDAYKSSESIICSELDQLLISYNKLKEQYSQNTQLILAKDAEIAKFMGDHIKHEQKMGALMKEKENVNNKVIALQKQGQKQTDLLKRYEESDKSKSETINQLEKQTVYLKSCCNVHESKIREIVQLTEELNAKLSKQSQKYGEISLLLREKEDKVNEIAEEKRKAEEEVKKMNTKIKHLSKRIQSNLFSSSDTATDDMSISGGKAGEDDVETLKMWKKVAQCNVCEFRIKNCVILKCMHVFCKECIDARLETRQRKCPQCGGMFGPNDVKPIYI